MKIEHMKDMLEGLSAIVQRTGSLKRANVMDLEYRNSLDEMERLAFDVIGELEERLEKLARRGIAA